MMRTFIAVAILLAAMPVAAHDWYTGMSNWLGQNCCGRKDCHPLADNEIRLNEAGELEIFVRGTWWRAFDERWFMGQSPDSLPHACIAKNDSVPRCVWIGTGA